MVVNMKTLETEANTKHLFSDHLVIINGPATVIPLQWDSVVEKNQGLIFEKLNI